MTKKLPKFVEDWISANTATARALMLDHIVDIEFIQPDDLREFLSNYVLCDSDPIGYLMHDKSSPLEYTSDQRLAGAVASTCPVYTTPELKTAPFHYPAWPGTV